MAKLTPKERLFVAAYVELRDGKAAAKKAGYKTKWPAQKASQILQKATVKEEIERGLAKFEATCYVNAERIERELAAIAFSDLGDFASWSGESLTLTAADLVDKDKRRAVAAIKTSQSQSDTGNSASVSIKLWDKLKALELLAKRHRFFETGGGADATGGRRVLDFRVVVDGADVNVED